jgi:hypothetical protein
MNILKLQARLAKHGCIAIIWDIDDVRGFRPDLSDEQCWQVLRECELKYDAGVGINWEVLELRAADLFVEPEDAP